MSKTRSTTAQFEFVLNAFRGHQTTQVIGLGVRLGLFQALHDADGLSAAELADRLKLHPPYVRVWCETAVAYHILDYANGRFSLPDGLATVLLNRDHPRWLGGFAEGFTTHFADDFARYPAAFQDGSIHGFAEHGEAFSAWVSSLTHPMQRLVAGKLLPEHYGDLLDQPISILDIGCGAGSLIFKLADAYPQPQFTGVDADTHGVALAQTRAAEHGYGKRVRFVHTRGEDFDAENAYDLALMFEVLHELPVEARPDVLRMAARALKPGGRLFILDETWADDPLALRDPAYAMSVLVQFSELIWGNVVATESEQTRLLTEAGFTDIQRGDLGGTFTLIFARKPE